MEKYKKLDNADITYIKEIVKDEERVLVGDFSGKGKITGRDISDHEICI